MSWSRQHEDSPQRLRHFEARLQRSIMIAEQSWGVTPGWNGKRAVSAKQNTRTSPTMRTQSACQALAVVFSNKAIGEKQETH
jgi:hypothetical protein